MASWEAVQIDPAEALEFQLSADDEAQMCTLRVTNANECAVSFKVKTTKPKRYLVRPNQGLVLPGGQETVVITLLAAEKKVILDEHSQTGAWDDSNKFLVQTAAVDEDFMTAYRQAPAKDQTNMVSDLWGSKAQAASIKQKKLKVVFSGGQGRGSGAPSMDLHRAREIQKDTLARHASAGARDRHVPANEEQLWDEVKTLRKKYDDLVAFTVNLTAEKDLIQRSLDSAREDLQREANSRRQLETQLASSGPRKAAGAGGKGGASGPGQSRGGIGLIYVVLLALVAYFLGTHFGAK